MSIFASDFTPASVSLVKEKIASGEKFILFIGRPTCPYCQRFEPNYRMLLVVLILIFSTLIVKMRKSLRKFKGYVIDMVLQLFRHFLYQKMVLSRSFVILHFLKKIFWILFPNF